MSDYDNKLCDAKNFLVRLHLFTTKYDHLRLKETSNKIDLYQSNIKIDDEYILELNDLYKDMAELCDNGLSYIALMGFVYIDMRKFPCRSKMNHYKIFCKEYINLGVARKFYGLLMSDIWRENFNDMVRPDVTKDEILLFRLSCP